MGSPPFTKGGLWIKSRPHILFEPAKHIASNVRALRQPPGACTSATPTCVHFRNPVRALPDPARLTARLRSHETYCQSHVSFARLSASVRLELRLGVLNPLLVIPAEAGIRLFGKLTEGLVPA